MERFDETKMDFIALLPVDITHKILDYLVPHPDRNSPGDVLNCCLVSTTWKQVVERSNVWSKVALNKIGDND